MEDIVETDNIEVNDTEKKVNGKTGDPHEVSEQDLSNGSKFLFGRIVNETEPEAKQFEIIPNPKQAKKKIRGPKCVRRRRDSYESEEEEPDYSVIDTLLKVTSAKSLVTRFRCQYCQKAHYSKDVIGQHIIYDHSIPSTSKKFPKYKNTISCDHLLPEPRFKPLLLLRSPTFFAFPNSPDLTLIFLCFSTR